MAELHYKIADQAVEFEAIHRLNYQTFVEEIPQHARNSTGTLIDRFHNQNVYSICLAGDELIGMVAGRCERPFSLDSKVIDLDSRLPIHERAVEIRLLAVKPEYRHRPVFAKLVVQLARYFRAMACDLAVISGTVLQLGLYEHLGFRRFGPLVGSGDAVFQPMYLTLSAWQNTKSLSSLAEPALVAGFHPGPVPVSAAVRRAFSAQPASHRSFEFVSQMTRVRSNLCKLTSASHVSVLVGTGTLANDAIAAQIHHRGQAGLVLANGEFGERLVAHAQSWKLRHQVVQQGWGEPFEWDELPRLARQMRPAWIWAVLSETSTGMDNSIARLRELCNRAGADLCLDAVSAVGLMPVDLSGVWLASAVSGKALAAYSGLATVFHDGRLASAGVLPRYLDLAAYERADGVPYSHSSNLVAALDCALASTSWANKFRRISTVDRDLRTRLRAHGLAPLVPDEVSTPGIVTLAVSLGTSSRQIALALMADGVALAFESAYLQRRNSLQICLMGEFDAATVAKIPSLLAARLRSGGQSSSIISAQLNMGTQVGFRCRR
jgi:aspartate aminotransferase-like enzyme/ribosomal protein S18 acetylase RimI-like enzyme